MATSKRPPKRLQPGTTHTKMISIRLPEPLFQQLEAARQSHPNPLSLSDHVRAVLVRDLNNEWTADSIKQWCGALDARLAAIEARLAELGQLVAQDAVKSRDAQTGDSQDEHDDRELVPHQSRRRSC